MTIYSLYIEPYYDSQCQQYINIVTINTIPVGPLSDYVTQLRFNTLSDFTGLNNKCRPLCIYAIKTINSRSCNSLNLLSSEQIDDLICFLMENNYTINKDLTKLMNNDRIVLNNGRILLFYINYNK